MSVDILIRNAAAVVSCDSADTIYYDADIAIKDGRIESIGEFRGDASRVIDGQNMFIYPGLTAYGQVLRLRPCAIVRWLRWGSL